MKHLEEDYKNLHQIPEEGFKEYKTSQYIYNRLKEYNCDIHTVGETGLIAFFDFKSDKTIGFRAELDGLNIIEETNLVYSSINYGYMHACAHDAHMSILLAMCDYLVNNSVNVNVCFIFQPSEEKYGGALQIINSDAYKKMGISELYALHLWPKLEKGKVFSKPDLLLASSTEIDIMIHSKSAHIANKKNGVCAILVAFKIINRLNDYKEAVFNCGKINSIGARNAVCADVLLECSVRNFSTTKKYFFLNYLYKVCEEIAEEDKVAIKINCENNIPAVLNDYGLFVKNQKFISNIVNPFYQAEDFSNYANTTKTLFFLLGTGDTEDLHSSKFCFDLDLLLIGYNLFISIINNN